ncbi:MAG: CDP-alcohol phosphatidyltransferase family protein [Chthoniobacterales bacterium]
MTAERDQLSGAGDGGTVSVAGGVESTYKTRDVESLLDIYFYRPIGYQFARLFAVAGFTPNIVSLLGAVVGVVAAHLYFYRDLRLNLIGMGLHVVANTLDNADGQLARLTSRGSLQGAIMDGVADYLVFVSVYIHLSLRYIAEGGSAAIWLLMFAAGISHAVQSMMIDYYRNAYLQLVAGKQSADANSSETVGAAYEATSWRQFWKKIGLRNYLDYTRRQERLAPELLRLRLAVKERRPPWLAEEYRARCQPMVKWCNGLAANPRMLVLFAVLLLDQPAWYFVVELTALNLLLFYVIRQHRVIFRALLKRCARI